MNTFFTSDQHYGHKNICKFAERPFSSVEEMNESLIQNHNSVVGHNDTVWFLGDFAFMDANKMQAILYRLNGQKHLIYGNHDKQIMKSPRKFIDEGLFKTIQHYKEISIDKQSIVLFHYGMRVWNKSHHGSWLLYGHSHGSLPSFGKSVDVGVDATEISTDYRPYEFEEVKRFMARREQAVVDHHQ